MSKILILLFISLIIYFGFRLRKGMSAIDQIYSKKNIKNLDSMRRQVQQNMNGNKTIK